MSVPDRRSVFHAEVCTALITTRSRMRGRCALSRRQPSVRSTSVRWLIFCEQRPLGRPIPRRYWRSCSATDRSRPCNRLRVQYSLLLLVCNRRRCLWALRSAYHRFKGNFELGPAMSFGPGIDFATFDPRATQQMPSEQKAPHIPRDAFGVTTYNGFARPSLGYDDLFVL